MNTAEAGPALPAAQRQEFIRAFLEQAWARPGYDRPVARVHVALMVTMGAVVVAVVVGVILQMLDPVPLPSSAAPAPPSPTAAPHYTAVAGWDCGTAADRGFEAAGRGAGWATVPRGGWAADGCHGTFEAIPMSGKAHTDSRRQSALWWFTPPPQMSRCDVAVYLPAGTNPADSGATAAQYFVTAGRGGATFAAFVLNQTQRRGAWQSVGTYPVNRGGIGVRLADRGKPAGPSTRIAVTQVRITCTG